MTARTFGLVTYGPGTVTLTELGDGFAIPRGESCKADSFLKVSLYNAIYEKFKKGLCRQRTALEAEIAKMGVTRSRRASASAFQRSATQRDFWLERIGL